MRRRQQPSGIDDDDPVEATVGAIHSDFAVAYPRDPTILGRNVNITFSFDGWEGRRSPQKGQVVLLVGVVKFAKGWRAAVARPVPLRARSHKPKAGD